MPFTYEYARPAVTVDVAVFSIQKGDLAVLLIRRGQEPFKGTWALPGGFVEQDEALEFAAIRELEEETGLTRVTMTQFGAFGDPGRDPRGHTVSVAYAALLSGEPELQAGDDAAEVAWHPLRTLPIGGRPLEKGAPKLAFDHPMIIVRALQHLLSLPAAKGARAAKNASTGKKAQKKGKTARPARRKG